MRGSPPWLASSKVAECLDLRSQLRAVGGGEEGVAAYPKLCNLVGWISVGKILDAVVATTASIDPSSGAAIRDALSTLWSLKICEAFDTNSLGSDYAVLGAKADEDTSSWVVHGVNAPARTLLEAISAGFLAPPSPSLPFLGGSGAHRIAIWTRAVADVQDAGWTTGGDSGIAEDARLINTFSQSDAIDWLYRRARVVDDATQQGVSEAGDSDITDAASLRQLAQLSLAELGLSGGGPGSVVCVHAEDRLLSAFRIIRASGMTGAGVVDDEGVLLGALTASDVRSLLPQHAAHLLSLTVAAYLEGLHRIRYYSRSGLSLKPGKAPGLVAKHHRQAEAHLSFVATLRMGGGWAAAGLEPPPGPLGDAQRDTVEGMAGGGDESESFTHPVGILPASERFGGAVAVRPSARLLDVLTLMSTGGYWGGYHIVFIVDEAQKPIGVITQADILRLLVGSPIV